MRNRSIIFLTAAAIAMFSTGAMAQGTALPDGCKLVSIARPGVDARKPDIHLTFRGAGSDVEGIKYCNPDTMMGKGVSTIGVASSPTAGSRVSVRTRDGKGVIGLPTNFENGDVHQIVCKLDSRGEIVAVLYAGAWSGTLPTEIVLTDDSARLAGDIEKHHAACRKAAPPNMAAQFKK